MNTTTCACGGHDDQTPAPVTRDEVFALATATVTHPDGGHGPAYFRALHAYAEQEGLTDRERHDLNLEAGRYADATAAEHA